MRRLLLLPAIALTAGLTGCDRSNATAAEATAASSATPAPVASALAPAPAPTPAPQDATQDMPVPQGANDPGMIPRGPGTRPPQTLAEMQARNDRIFARLDANADGAITGAELAVLASGPQGGRAGGRIREMFSRADADRNSRITLEEIRDATAGRFARMDADGDGVVTDEERPDRP